MLCTLTNRENALRVVYDTNRRVVAIEGGKSVTADLDQATITILEEMNRSGVGVRCIRALSPGAQDQRDERVRSDVDLEEAPPEQEKRAHALPTGSRRRYPVDAGPGALLIQAEAGMPWFQLRQSARRVLGKAWPGAQAKRPDVIEALRKAAND